MSRVFVRALAMELKWLAALLLALSLASRVQVITGEMENDKIKSPIDWICITTAGGIVLKSRLLLTAYNLDIPSASQPSEVD